jgi:hypothetical protein
VNPTDAEIDELLPKLFDMYNETLWDECGVSDVTPSYATSDLLLAAYKTLLALRDERRELRADRERLDWWLEHPASVIQSDGKMALATTTKPFAGKMQASPFMEPRLALDVARGATTVADARAAIDAARKEPR